MIGGCLAMALLWVDLAAMSLCPDPQKWDQDDTQCTAGRGVPKDR